MSDTVCVVCNATPLRECLLSTGEYTGRAPVAQCPHPTPAPVHTGTSFPAPSLFIVSLVILGHGWSLICWTETHKGAIALRYYNPPSLPSFFTHVIFGLDRAVPAPSVIHTARVTLDLPPRLQSPYPLDRSISSLYIFSSRCPCIVWRHSIPQFKIMSLKMLSFELKCSAQGTNIHFIGGHVIQSRQQKATKTSAEKLDRCGNWYK